MEHAGGDTQCAVAQNDDLLHAVGSSHTDPPPLADLMSNVLDEHVCRFRFLRVDHMDIVVLLNAAGAARHTIGIEYKNKIALLVALIVAQMCIRDSLWSIWRARSCPASQSFRTHNLIPAS